MEKGHRGRCIQDDAGPGLHYFGAEEEVDGCGQRGGYSGPVRHDNVRGPVAVGGVKLPGVVVADRMCLVVRYPFPDEPHVLRVEHLGFEGFDIVVYKGRVAKANAGSVTEAHRLGETVDR